MGKKMRMSLQNVNKMCRACLKFDSITENYSLFKISKELESNIAVAVTACTSVKISHDDGLPTLICESCFCMLKVANCFRTQCLRSDKILRKHVHQQMTIRKEKLQKRKKLRTRRSISKTLEEKEDSKIKVENDQNAIDNDLKNIKSEIEDKLSALKCDEVNCEENIKKEYCTNSEASNDDNDDLFECEVKIKTEDMIEDSFEECFDDISTNTEENVENNDFKIPLIRSSPEQNKYLQQIKKISGTGNCLKPLNQTNKLKFRRQKQLGGRKSFECDICNKVFTAKSTLKVHKYIHSGERPHSCDVCPKSFRKISDLKKHQLIHAGIQPHMCDICGKSFSQLANLTRHQLLHSGEKPHKCEVCQRSFRLLNVLKTHQLIHSGERPHMCDLCGKSYTKLSSMKSHKLVHQSERPHKCDVCSKSFLKLNTLKRHKLTHSGERPYSCDVCNKAFTRFSYINIHKLTHCGQRKKRGRAAKMARLAQETNSATIDINSQ